MTKIQVIGSGSMWSNFNSACYLVDDTILIDIPNGTCKSLIRGNINVKKINDILITHFHGDHYFDMPFIMLLKKKIDSVYLNIYCAKNGNNKIKKLLKLAFPYSFKKVFKSLKIMFYNDNYYIINKEYEIERVLLDHGTFKPAFGYIIKIANKRIGFTGDTTICDNLAYMMSKCDYIFGDCMFIKGTTKHMGVDFLEKIMDKYPKCKYVVSHLEDETREYLKKQKLKNVIIPNDGDIINI